MGELIMKKTIFLFFFLILLFSCSNSENNKLISDIEISGEKIEIATPKTGIDSASGKFSPIIKHKLSSESPIISYPENSPTIFLFVAHWCPFCQEEIPEVVQWIEEGNIIEKGVKIVLVVTSIDPEKPNYPPDEWLFNEKWQYPVIYDDKKNLIAEHFGVSYFPSWVFTENDGMVAFTHAGKITKEELSQLVN
jgi:cytochrome c biogenesis protein CcmG, thiol:disulfide interchange protein DsbE